MHRSDGSSNPNPAVDLASTLGARLPVGRAERPNPDPSSDPPWHRGGETVLLAEDEVLVRDLTEELLTRAGYRVLVACDGQEALTCFEQNADGIDLLLLDVVMPRMGGVDVLREIRKGTPQVPAVFCTGYSAGVISQASTGPVTWVLRKPFLPSRLLGTVRDALDCSRLAG